MMIGIGTPKSQSNAPRPKPIFASIGLCRSSKPGYNLPSQAITCRSICGSATRNLVTDISLGTRTINRHCSAGDRSVMDSDTLQKPPLVYRTDDATNVSGEISSQDP